MDGSAQRFVSAILRTGLAPVAGPRVAIRVLKPVRWEQGGVMAELDPGGHALDRLRDRLPRRGDRPPGPDAIDGERRLRARARRLPDLLPPAVDVEMMQANGLALGGSLDNAVVVDGDAGAQSRAACAAPTSSCVTRCSTRSATSRWRARRSSAPTAVSGRATARRTGCCGRSSPTRGPTTYVTLDADAAALLPGAGVGAADLRRAG